MRYKHKNSWFRSYWTLLRIELSMFYCWFDFDLNLWLYNNHSVSKLTIHWFKSSTPGQFTKIWWHILILILANEFFQMTYFNTPNNQNIHQTQKNQGHFQGMKKKQVNDYVFKIQSFQRKSLKLQVIYESEELEYKLKPKW